MGFIRYTETAEASETLAGVFNSPEFALIKEEGDYQYNWFKNEETGKWQLSAAERERLVLQFAPLVWKLCGLAFPGVVRIAGGYADAFQEGMCALIDCADNYKPDLGVKFSTYAYTAIRRRIANSANRLSMIHVPESVFKGNGDRWKSKKEWFEAVSNALMAYYPVTMSQWFMSDGTPAAESIEAPVARESSPELKITLKRAMKLLTFREAFAVKLRYGLYEEEGGGPKTLCEVGHRMGISKERARQLVELALRKMKQLDGLKDHLNNE
jgi:RNA polymerase sigma factor (sigma-70 family)